MKTIAIVLTLIMGSIWNVEAQTTPTPPPSPSATVSIHSDSDESNSSYSYSLKDSDSSQKNGNTSISVSSNDSSYSFSAKHSGEKDQEIKELLLREMGTNNLMQSKNKYTWIVSYGNDDVYEIEWKKGRLSMEVDKTIADKELVDKITEIGKNAKTIITGKSDQDRSVERERREVDRKLREADRMRREAERLRQRAERDAERIKREADRLENDARRAVRDASKRGTVSNPVSGLLQRESTVFTGEERNNNWVLPKLNKVLVASLIKDGIIKEGEDLNLSKETSSIHINGTKLEGREMVKYIRLFMDNGVRPDVQFTYYSKSSHLVIIDENPRIENFLRTAERQGLINSLTKKMNLEINGNSVRYDGKELSQQEVSNFNKLLLENRIIPAPGKTITIMSKDSYKLGYSIDKKSHIGTWVMGGN